MAASASPASVIVAATDKALVPQVVGVTARAAAWTDARILEGLQDDGVLASLYVPGVLGDGGGGVVLRSPRGDMFVVELVASTAIFRHVLLREGSAKVLQWAVEQALHHVIEVWHSCTQARAWASSYDGLDPAQGQAKPWRDNEEEWGALEAGKRAASERVTQIRAALADAGFVLSEERAKVRDAENEERIVALYDCVFARTLRHHAPNRELAWLWARTSGSDGPGSAGEQMHVIVAPRPGGTGPADHVDVLAYNLGVVPNSGSSTSIVSLAPFAVNACEHVRKRWLDAALLTLYRDVMDAMRVNVLAIVVDATPSYPVYAASDARIAALDAALSGSFFRFEASEPDDGETGTEQAETQPEDENEGGAAIKRRRVQPRAIFAHRRAHIYLRALNSDTYVSAFGPRANFSGKPPTLEQIAVAATMRTLAQPARSGSAKTVLGLAEVIADWRASLLNPRGAPSPRARASACVACSLME